MKIRYFDHAATTPIRAEVIREMAPYLGAEYGNASSMYSIGKKAKRAIDDARAKCAKAIHCSPNEIYFTSGGSESDNLAIKGIALANKSRGNHIITSKIEHPAVLNTCKWLERNGFNITYLDVDQNGKISLDELVRAIKNNTILISIMFANNEIGTIQPIEQIGRIARSRGIIFHTDAVQAVGNVKINVNQMNIGALSMSGHKIYAPKGVGCLYVRSGIKFEAIINGGHQEKDKRAGTENVAGIVGIGKAIELMYSNFDEYNEKIMNLRDFYISEIERRIDYIKLNGDRFDRLPGNANISFRGIDGAELLMNLDNYGICASAGSACSSGSIIPSHVLLSIGLREDYIKGTLRTSFGMDNTLEDIKFLVDKIEMCVKNLRA